MRRTAIIAALLATWAGGAFAQPAPSAAAQVTIIHAGHLIDRPGRPVRGPSTIVITGGRITEVREGLAPPPPGATLVDLSDRYVLPGLIDSHVHLESDAGGNAGLVEYVTMNDAQFAFQAMANGRKTLEAGFTTVRNLGGGPAIGALRDAVARGVAVGPRILDAASGISTTSGHGDPQVGMIEDLHPGISHENVCDGADDCRRAVRTQIRRGADVIKTMTTGGVNSRIGAGLGAQMMDDEIKAIVETAHLYGKKVAVHAHGADGINIALNAGVDSVEHGTLMDAESIRLFRKTGAYYVPTLSTVNGYLERIAADPNAYPPDVRAKIDWRIGITGDALRKAVPAGVKIAFGTDAGVSKHGRNADEFELMVKHGMTPTQAIQAATVNAADLLGLSAEIGTIEPGKAADIIAVSGDPVADVTRLKRVGFVMARGVVRKDVR
jgi:imidazolonepropionase-like amidohydrolase